MSHCRHFTGNIISVVHTSVRLGIMKLFHPKNISCHVVERFSPNVVFNVDKKSKVRLGKRVSIHSYSRFSVNSGGELVVNDNVSFNIGCMVTCKKKVEIGKNVTFGPRVMMFDHNHIMDSQHGVIKNTYELGEIFIGENTWIGAGTIILMNSKIGKNCVIAAGSVVKGNVPDNTVLIQKRKNIYKNLE